MGMGKAVVGTCCDDPAVAATAPGRPSLWLSVITPDDASPDDTSLLDRDDSF